MLTGSRKSPFQRLLQLPKDYRFGKFDDSLAVFGKLGKDDLGVPGAFFHRDEADIAFNAGLRAAVLSVKQMA